jgi:hypothetical protein
MKLSKLLLLFSADVRTFLQWEEWIEGAGNVLYWLLLTAAGNRSLGEEYVRIAPVDLRSKSLLLRRPSKRLIFALLSGLLPVFVKKGSWETLDSINSVQFYWNGNFPTLLHRIFSIRYVRHKNSKWFKAQRDSCMSACV